MGFQYEFNWILKLSDLDEPLLKVQETYSFSKSGVRAFPLGMPIDLVNANWEAVARCVINTITLTEKATTGKYTVIEIYDNYKRKMLTDQWRDLLKITKGFSNLKDYKDIHIT